MFLLCYNDFIDGGFMDNKVKKVLKFYVLCNSLKDVVRTGWKVWNVKRDRVESIAEHIYGVQMLAIAMYKEFEYDIDIEKVIYMLAVHELEEVIIGDLTIYDISREEKKKIGKEAVDKILSDLANSIDINNLIDEFDARETREALFSYYCDKLECDIQAKIYDEEDCVNLEEQFNNKVLSNEKVAKLIESEKTWGNAWLESDRHLYKDENFILVLDYLKENSIKDLS